MEAETSRYPATLARKKLDIIRTKHHNRSHHVRRRIVHHHLHGAACVGSVHHLLRLFPDIRLKGCNSLLELQLSRRQPYSQQLAAATNPCTRYFCSLLNLRTSLFKECVDLVEFPSLLQETGRKKQSTSSGGRVDLVLAFASSTNNSSSSRSSSRVRVVLVVVWSPTWSSSSSS